MSTDIEIQHKLYELDTSNLNTGIALRELHGEIRAMIARMKGIQLEIEAAAVEHIQATGNDIELGEGRRWYLGSTKTIKSRNDLDTLHAVLAAAAGDFDRLTTGANGVLAASPWKFGAVKELLGVEKFEALFATTYAVSLETGKVLKSLKVGDDTFAKARARMEGRNDGNTSTP